MNTPILFVPTSSTGETPTAFCGPEFGGRSDYTHRDWSFSGCIDAPDLTPAGSHRNNNYDQLAVTSFVARES